MKRILSTLSEKWPEYLLEVIVITAGILGAFALNSWNDGRKTSIERQELIADLIEDFEYNLDVLVTDKIVWTESKISTMDQYMKLIRSDQQLVGMDSLRNMARMFFRFETYNPNLTAYKTAQSTGSLSLLDNKSLLEQFTLFTDAYSTHQMINKWSGEAFFENSLWELRKTVTPGTIYNSKYPYNPSSLLSFAEYQQLMSSPLAQNALRNAYVLEQNTLEQLRDMEAQSKIIIRILNEMKDNQSK